MLYDSRTKQLLPKVSSLMLAYGIVRIVLQWSQIGETQQQSCSVFCLRKENKRKPDRLKSETHCNRFGFIYGVIFYLVEHLVLVATVVGWQHTLILYTIWCFVVCERGGGELSLQQLFYSTFLLKSCSLLFWYALLFMGLFTVG